MAVASLVASRRCCLGWLNYELERTAEALAVSGYTGGLGAHRLRAAVETGGLLVLHVASNPPGTPWTNLKTLW